MWVTVDGERSLGDAEARLLCRAVGSMLSDFVAVIRNRTYRDQECWLAGIDWFDQWEVEQKVWLLERVATALLTDQPAPKPAAMCEATVDAIFQHVFERVAEELEQDAFQDSEGDDVHREPGTVDHLILAAEQRWSDDVIRALRQQQRRVMKIGRAADQANEWRRLIMQIVDRILGVAAYQTAESYRDQQAAKIALFLSQKGLPADFLTQIPPLLGQRETEACIERLRDLLGQFGH